MLEKTQKQQQKTQKKQIKKTKLLLQLFLIANLYRVNGPIDTSLERTPI